MIPCRNANCQEWIDPVSGDYCESCNPTPKVRTRTNRGYDALEVRGIGIVSPRRILAHRPKSVRRNFGTSNPSGVSYSDMRDVAELERKRNVPQSVPGKTVAEARAERRAQTIKLLGIVGTLGENDRD